MLAVNINPSTGSIAAVLAAVRDIPQRVIPYAASTALTRVARRIAVEEMPAEMKRVFDRPTRYTLNSLRVVPAKRDDLRARVYVKDDATNNGTRPEDYLLPQVDGGTRREKRFERAMRYRGLLPNGWRAVPASGAPLDAYGNLRRGEIQRILTATKTTVTGYQDKSTSARSKANSKNAPYFGVALGKVSIVGGEMVRTRSHLAPGIYKRTAARGIKPVLIFTSKSPNYRRRLDFAGVSERVALEHFATEFNQAAQAILNRGPR
jgi:hypothetical protein